MNSMPVKTLSGLEKVTQLFPLKKEVPLKGLYLGQKLAEISVKIGRSLVVTDFITDKNGIIAKVDDHNHFQVPLELRNTSDWRLFQELMAQADVIISSSAYLKRVSTPGSQAENILSQFKPRKGFEELGEWRLSSGYKKRSPDLAIVTRNLDFPVAQGVLSSGRRIIIFTTYAQAGSDQAKALRAGGLDVVGSGETGVEGNRMIDHLSNELDYRVIMMATGPAVLRILLEAERLDLLYITEAQLEILYSDSSTVQNILSEGKKIKQLKGFRVNHKYLQDDVIAENGSHISQVFLRYERKGIFTGRSL
jgi:riboflavin biosynthesis pyrimidine reductase